MAKPLCDCRHGWSLCNIAIPTTTYHGDHSLRGLVKTRNGFEHILKGIRGMRIIHHDGYALSASKKLEPAFHGTEGRNGRNQLRLWDAQQGSYHKHSE